MPEIHLYFIPQASNNGGIVTVASKMYAQNEFQVRPEFEGASRRVLGTAVGQLDFADGQRSAQTINSWVKAETGGKIAELVSPGGVFLFFFIPEGG